MSSPLHIAGNNWSAEANKLRKMGMSLPGSASAARAEAINVATSVQNRTLTAAMNRQRLGNYRMRQAANMQIALPKIRQPLGTLQDKGIPFNVEDESELIEIRKWCRLFYCTHPLIPLLIEIYSRFPVVGMEFTSKDPMIKNFYEDLFFGDDLNYMEFLPDQFGREYFLVGEVTALAHFNEALGIFTSEEILNPDNLRVNRSLFVQRDRVQLLVKEMVEGLRQGPTGTGGMLSSVDGETPSERLQRTKEYEQLARDYPEIIQAAAQNDGLDISEALISRVANKTTPWATRGTPHLLRSFRTLMSEESLNAAQDAVADRLYSPMILATLGVPDLGDGLPWIPTQEELDDLRDDMQTAFAADFRFIAHNFGLKIENVFGRESVPNLDSDFQRIDAQLLQTWGIGEALISGGTGGPYASSALNREFATQMMVTFQNSLRRHILKRAEVIAEAQGHYDYDLKGGTRVPVYREIVFTDEETGKEYIRRVPKLLLPEVKFSTLNLRDEAQERAFIAQLKAMGVPVSDKALAVNIDVEFEPELELQAEETVAKLMATAQAMRKVQILCDQQNLPYPPELAQHLMSTLQLRQGKAQTEMVEGQAEVAEVQTDLQEKQLEIQDIQVTQALTQLEAMTAPGMPGQPGGPPMPTGVAPPPGAPIPPGGGMLPPQPGEGVNPPVAPGPGAPGPGGPVAGAAAQEQPAQPPPQAEPPGAEAFEQLASKYAYSTRPPSAKPPAGKVVAAKTTSTHGPRIAPKDAALQVNAPQASPPKSDGPQGPMGPELPPGVPSATEQPKDQQRPPQSDEQKGTEPRAAAREIPRNRVTDQTRKRRKRTRKGEEQDHRLTKFREGPSTYHASYDATEEQVDDQVRRLEAIWRHTPMRHPKVSDLIKDPQFYRAVNGQQYMSQIQADWPGILAGEEKATESTGLLKDMLMLYSHIYGGVEPEW